MIVKVTPSFIVEVDGKPPTTIKGNTLIFMNTSKSSPFLPKSYIAPLDGPRFEPVGGLEGQPIEHSWVHFGIELLCQLRKGTMGTIFSKRLSKGLSDPPEENSA